MLVLAGLAAIMLAVLILPFSVKKVEEQLEVFLFIMGCAAVTLTSQWNSGLIKEALLAPLKITAAVLVAGLLFNLLKKPIAKHLNAFIRLTGIRTFIFLLVVLLGLLSSVITAIIAALLLVEIIEHLKLERKTEIKVVVMACFSIGMGAALTPLGEPLTTIAIAKLKDLTPPADFWFFVRHLGLQIVLGVMGIGIATLFMTGRLNRSEDGHKEENSEATKDVIIRTAKVYLFVMALIFLGTGFKPIVDEYVSKISYQIIYWLNMISAILDNATLAAAEIGPSMSILQIKSAILGLIIAGGMLIPGNIPNIISAGKLKIKSKEWAVIGVPVGLAIMLIYFVIIELFG